MSELADIVVIGNHEKPCYRIDNNNTEISINAWTIRIKNFRNDNHNKGKSNDERAVKMDAYLEEELYDILTYNIQNPNASDFESKKKRLEILVEYYMLMVALMKWRTCFIQLSLE